MREKTQLSLYWKCQLAGWSMASLYWNLQAFLDGFYILWIGLLQFLSDIALYSLITHLYHRFALRHQWETLELKPLISRLVPALIVLTVLYLVVTVGKIYGFHLFLTHSHAGTMVDFFRSNALSILIAGIRLMSIWLLAHHLYYYGKREVTLARENARLALTAKDAQMNTLQAQLNPHFFFNALNTIKALVDDDPPSARRAIDLMSDLLRSTLYGNPLVTQSLREELGLVRDYLELEKLRLEDRLQIAITYPPELADVQLLRYSIQTLVENAVKHGISRQRSGGLLRVAITGYKDQIEIQVENPGTMGIATPHEGLGLKNLNERLNLYYQHKARLVIREKAGTVFASIWIPKT